MNTSGIPNSDSFIARCSHKEIWIARVPTQLIDTLTMAFMGCFFCLAKKVKLSDKSIQINEKSYNEGLA